MVTVPYEELARLKRCARDLAAELARYSAQFGLTDEARRLFGFSKNSPHPCDTSLSGHSNQAETF